MKAVCINISGYQLISGKTYGVVVIVSSQNQNHAFGKKYVFLDESRTTHTLFEHSEPFFRDHFQSVEDWRDSQIDRIISEQEIG